MGGSRGARGTGTDAILRAMSEENVEATKRFIDAYNRRDVEGMLADLDPEIEWLSGFLIGLGGEAAVFRGYEGVREALRDLYEALGTTRIESAEIRDLGDRTVTIGRFHARGKESGAESESPWGAVADFKDGRAIRIRSYLSVEEVLEAAGLSE
jgi:ketosteroid isomerase-like protein